MEALVDVLERDVGVGKVGSDVVDRACERKEELVEWFVQRERVKARNAAFRILTVPRVKVARVAVRSDAFRQYARDVLEREKSDGEVTRVAVVWRNCVGMLGGVCFPELVASVLEFVELSSVWMLLEDVLQIVKADCGDVWEALIGKAEEQPRVWRLFEKVQQEVILCPKILNRICESQCAGKWMALTRVVAFLPRELLRRLAEEAVGDINCGIFEQQHECAVKFLCGVISVDPGALDVCSADELVGKVRGLYECQESHTIALSAANQLITAVVGSGNVANETIGHILKLVADVISSNSYIAVMFAKDALCKMFAVAKRDESLSEYLSHNKFWNEMTELRQEFEDATSVPWFGGGISSPISSFTLSKFNSRAILA